MLRTAGLSLVDVLGGLGGTLTSLSVLGVLVGDGELSKVVSNHIELDFNGEIFLASVDTDDTTNHGGHDDSIAESGLDNLGLLTRCEVQLRLFDSLNKLEVSTLDTVVSSC